MNKLLIVVNGEEANPLDSVIKIENNTDPECDILPAVEQWFEDKGIEVDYHLIEEIVMDLDVGQPYWWKETWCFNIVEV